VVRNTEVGAIDEVTVEADTMRSQKLKQSL